MKILLVDDDRDLVELLAFALERAGMMTLHAVQPENVLERVVRDAPHLAVLEVTVGGTPPFELLRELRRRSDIPVVMLSSRASEEDKIRGLELGADDYITKPFSHRELIARIRAVLRRRGAIAALPIGGEIVVGQLKLDLARHAVVIDGRPVRLSQTEFRLLQLLAGNAGRVVPTGVLLREIWGYDDPGGRDVVRVTLYRLRRKLALCDGTSLLTTVSGVGVMLAPAEVAAAAV